MDSNDLSSLYDSIKMYTELREKHMQTREKWFQSILVAAAGLLGALVALTNNNRESFEVRILFVLTIVLLVLGVLCVAIALSYNIACSNRAKEEARSLLLRKNSHENEVPYISMRDPKKLLYFDVLSYVFFSLSFASLIAYVVVKNIPEII